MIPKRMRAAVVPRSGEIVVREVKTPSPGKDEAVVQIKYCGICDTDINILNGIYSSEYLPLTPGHEFVGHVVEVGREVRAFTGGELVTADINLGCGTCFYCRRNAKLMCEECKQIGIHMDGAFAEYLSIPASQLYRLPDDMPVENGALIEPISCVVRAARLGELTFASSVVIMGGGSIGLLHLQMAKNCGATPIIVIDDVPERLEWAKRLEADFVLSRDEASDKQVRTLTDGRGADFVIESDGKVENYDHIFQLVRPGGKIIAFGLPPENSTAQFRPFHVGLREISMTGSCAGMGDDLSDAITLVKHGRFDLEPFTDVKIPLERIEDGFNRSMDDTTSLKILISMD